MGTSLQVSLVYQDDGSTVMHAVRPDKPAKYGRTKRLRELAAKHGDVALDDLEEIDEAPAKEDGGPLLEFEVGANGSSALRNSRQTRVVRMTINENGESGETFGVLASTFRHERRTFELKIQVERIGSQTQTAAGEDIKPSISPRGVIEIVTRAHKAGLASRAAPPEVLHELKAGAMAKRKRSRRVQADVDRAVRVKLEASSRSPSGSGCSARSGRSSASAASRRSSIASCAAAAPSAAAAAAAAAAVQMHPTAGSAAASCASRSASASNSEAAWSVPSSPGTCASPPAPLDDLDRDAAFDFGAGIAIDAREVDPALVAHALHGFPAVAAADDDSYFAPLAFRGSLAAEAGAAPLAFGGAPVGAAPGELFLFQSFAGHGQSLRPVHVPASRMRPLQVPIAPLAEQWGLPSAPVPSWISTQMGSPRDRLPGVGMGLQLLGRGDCSGGF
eukprot:tig00000262_g23082.t1